MWRARYRRRGNAKKAVLIYDHYIGIRCERRLRMRWNGLRGKCILLSKDKVLGPRQNRSDDGIKPSETRLDNTTQDVGAVLGLC